MKCRYCGAEFQDDEIICPICGTELQMVPDYNPLDDALERQIRGAVNKTLNENQPEGTRSRQNTGRVRQDTDRTMLDERERRRKRAERRRLLEKKRRQKLMIIGGVALVLLVVVGIIGYQNSYAGRVRKGYKLLNEKEYDEAIACFQTAIDKNAKNSEAYTGVVETYMAMGEQEKGEQFYQAAIKEHSDNVQLYKALIEFYMETKQESQIAYLLKDCKNNAVLSELKNYQVTSPKFSLDENKSYDEVQALELTSDGKDIYYTTDGSTPTTSSRLYKEPIKLEEGITIVKAISVNEEEIPSIVVSKKYTIIFPMADAPSVTPSTGQYEEPQKIKVNVPENYEAYYTMDGSDPVPESLGTQKYSGEVDMPEGNTIFKAVLVDQNGRISDETIRNYELVIEEQDDQDE